MSEDLNCLYDDHPRIDRHTALEYFKRYVYEPAHIFKTTYQQAKSFLETSIKKKNPGFFNAFIFTSKLIPCIVEDLAHMSNTNTELEITSDWTNALVHFVTKVLKTAEHNPMEMGEMVSLSGRFSMQLVHDMVCTNKQDIISESENRVSLHNEFKIDNALTYTLMRFASLETRKMLYDGSVVPEFCALFLPMVEFPPMVFQEAAPYVAYLNINNVQHLITKFLPIPNLTSDAFVAEVNDLFDYFSWSSITNTEEADIYLQEVFCKLIFLSFQQPKHLLLERLEGMSRREE